MRGLEKKICSLSNGENAASISSLILLAEALSCCEAERGKKDEEDTNTNTHEKKQRKELLGEKDEEGKRLN